MDFWNLVAGKKKTTQPISEDDLRLSRLKKEHLFVQRCFKTISAKTQYNSLVLIRTCINNILRLIRDDARSAAQLSVSYSLSDQVYVDVCRLAVKVSDENVFRDTIKLFSFLLNNDVDNELLAMDTYAQALLGLIDGVLIQDGRATQDAQTAALALMFDVASKLRVYPEAVHAWFTRLEEGRPDQELSMTSPETIFEVDADRTAFPLCQYFLNYVYQEGKIGDFARMGLLYIYDSATRSDRLETWIIESDLPRLLASGLGALYSQLSRKLTILHPREELPMILALSEEGNDFEETDIESLYSPGTQERLTTFISYITFWRDMIDRCRSDVIKDILVDNFHVFFLQQILYPSILESSDVDGGSAVAVLSYCSSLLEALAQEDLIHHMLHFLLALPGLPSSRPVTRDVSERPRSRATMALEHFPKSQDVLNSSFFNLVDLILATIKSTNSEAVTAALRLVALIMRQNHQYAIGSLVRVLPAKQSVRRTIGVLLQEVTDLLRLAEEIGESSIENDSYENSLQDALAMIESHDCSKVHPSLLMLHGHGSESAESASQVTKPAVYKHRLRLDDPLMLALLSLLDQFFVNEIEVNLALTEVLAHLASCPYVCLEGWLAAEPSVSQTIIDAQSIQNTSFDGTELYMEEDKEGLEQKRIRAYKKACQIPPTQSRHQPSLVMILHRLKDDLENATAMIADFKQLVASRKRAFEGASEMEDDASRSSLAFSRRAKSSGRAVNAPSSVSSPRTQNSTIRSPNDRSIAGIMSTGLPPLFELIAGKPKVSASPTKTLSTRTSHSTIAPLSPAASARAGGPALPSTEAEQEFNVFEQNVTFALDECGGLTPIGSEQDPFELREDQPKATLSRVLTNVIILQDFVLELAAIMQVRAGLCDGDVAFC